MNTDYNKYLLEVESKVNKTPKNVSAQRKLLKQNYSFSELLFPEQLKIWDYIWNNASDSWTKGQSYFYCESRIKNKDFLIYSWEIIKHWQNKVDDWGYSDSLSKIYTKILELIPNQVLEQLEQWNKSTGIWDKRQSVVSLLYFSRTKKIVLPYKTIIRFIDRLINDREYYVQKAVGWSLKELYTVYPAETLKYLQKNIKNMSTIIFCVATEKLKREDKERLKKIRQATLDVNSS